MTPVWKPIPRYESRYEASDTGEIRSLVRGKCHVLQQAHHMAGYLVVWLWNDHHWRRKEFVHRLVAEAFIENPSSLPVVNHIDRNKKHNTPVNLEWVCYKDNTAHWMRSDAEIALSNATF